MALVNTTSVQRNGPRAKRSPTLSEEEQAVAKRLSGGFGWPTVVLAIGLLAAEIGVVVLWATGVIPMAAGFLANAYLSYAWYTVHHDATHKAISGRNPELAWIEQACGHVAGFALQIEFVNYSANHLKHHAHTNTSNDPDLVVKGPMWQLPIKWALGNVFMTIGALPGGNRLVEPMLAKLVPLADGSPREKAARAKMRRFSQVGLVLLLAAIPFGAFWPAVLLWWLPAKVGVLFLMVLFQWLPHFPFDRTDRFGATRVNRFPGSTWVLLQQDRHLIHHLYPSIPWYRYRAAFRELRPLLEANGAVIQGTGSNPRIPIQLRETATRR
jgi:beta-carotene hydroxylase